MSRKHAIAFVLTAVAVVVLSAVTVVGKLNANVWHTDFAVFYQAGHLTLSGEASEIYRYVAPTPEAHSALSPAWDAYIANDGGWGGYMYAQAPWHAVLVAPLAVLPIETAYVIHSAAMVGGAIVSAALLVRYTNRGWWWSSLLLVLLVFAPYVDGNPWNTPHYVFMTVLTEPLKHGSPIAATLWFGQYTPLLLGLLVAGLTAAHLSRMRWAALFIVIAMMKPSVLFVLPAFALVLNSYDDLVSLARWGAIWSVVFNVVFFAFPGYPWSFIDAATGYTGTTLPILLQAHNWVLYFGVVVAAVALSRDGAGVETDPGGLA